MATHLVGWDESINSATLTAVDALVDDVLSRPTAERFFIPAGYNFLHWVAALGIDLTRAALVSPSLGMRRENLEIVPRVRGDDAFELPNVNVFKPVKPIELSPTEHLEAQAAEDNAAASRVILLAALGPAQLPPVPAGDIRRIRLTGTTTLTANVWTTVTLTEDTTLETGLYELVGFIPISATGIAARVLFQGGGYRPGMPVLPAAEAAAVDFNPNSMERIMGYAMGRFDHNNIPQVQYLATAGDTAETVFMDLVKVG